MNIKAESKQKNSQRKDYEKIIINNCFIFFYYRMPQHKKTAEKTSDTKTTEFQSVVNDSIQKETINQGIDDTVTVEVPVSDPMLDAKIDEILSKLNTSKKSGSNSYKVKYDPDTNTLTQEATIGETKDSEIISNKENTTEKSFEQTVTENTKKVIKMIPWWGWAILVWIMRKHIINIIAIFIPGVREIKTINDLLNPPNRKE